MRTFAKVKRLLMIRHAKSSWDNPTQSDFERPLNKRGERDAPRMGRQLKEKEFTIDLFITSPAKSAIVTCEKMAEILGYPAEKIRAERALYHADEDGILKVVKKLSDKDDVVLMFGHNPGLTDFANLLLNEHIINVPTCGIVSCLIDVASWKEVKWGEGKLEFYDFPKRKEKE
jgi:phosphohistidine phosphatase